MGVVRRTISRHAAPLRRNATEAEQILWYQLRDRRLGGHKFRRQWTLYPYIVDFCCLEAKLIVEVDGGQHTPQGDARKTAELRARGFRILRFWNNDVLPNRKGVLKRILQAVGGSKQRGEEGPHPNPLPLAGEGV